MRSVQCQVLVNATTYAPSELCLLQEKPLSEKNCFQMTCHAATGGLGTAISHSASVEHNHTSKTQWRTGSWGSVSHTYGTRSRMNLGQTWTYESNSLVELAAEKRSFNARKSKFDLKFTGFSFMISYARLIESLAVYTSNQTLIRTPSQKAH